MFRNISLILISAVLFSGCLNTRFKPVDRAALQNVRATKSGRQLSDVNYMGAGQKAGVMFGVIGAAVAHAAAGDQRVAARNAINQHQVDIAQMLSDQINKRLDQKLGSVKLPNGTSLRVTPGSVVFDSTSQGVVVNTFSAVELFGADGTVKKRWFVPGKSLPHKQEFWVFVKDREEFRRAFEEAIDNAAQTLSATL